MTALPAGPPRPTASVVASVAFCPCPPVLVPAVEGRAAADTEVLRLACARAVSAMLATGPEVVVVVGGGADPGARFGPGDGGDLQGFGVPFEIGFAGPVRAGSSRLPLAHTVGAWLLDQAGYSGTRVGVAPGSLATVSAEFSGRVGILAMGDGSARRTHKAPGYLDAAAEPFDRLVATALASGDADTLAALDPAEGDRLLAAGTRTWKAVGTVVRGRRITARQHYDDAPFGVGYLVTDWQLA